MKRKLLSIFLVAAMIVSIFPITVFAEFSDVQGHWGQAEIEKWSEKGIIVGSDGMFRPNAPITRGEMAVILDRVMKYQVKADNSFKDLGQSWYTEAVLKANAAGVILGNDGIVRPNDNITREEAAVVFARALRIHPDTEGNSSPFKDRSQISSWAVNYVSALASKGYINGDSNGNFNPKAAITRAEVVKMLDNSVKELYNKAGEYSDKVVEGNVVINSPSVTLKDMEIRGNLIVAEGVGEGDVHLDNVRISGDTIVKGGGVNSIYFNSVTVGGALIVNKTGGDLRIVATGTTKVSVATLESGAILVTRDLTGGAIEEVIIPESVAAGQNIVLEGNFANVRNNAEDITIQATGKIENLVLNAKTTVSGQVSVTNLTTAPGADSVINDKEISGGQSNVKVNPSDTDTGTESSSESGNNGNSSGGNSGSSGGNTGGNSGGSSGGSSGGNSGGNNNDKIWTVTFVSNGGTDIEPVNVKNSETIKLPSEPTKADATFIGWYTDEELTQEFDPSTPITSNITLYAKWSGWQEPVEIDSRFAAGYPKASVNPDSSKIELKVKLVGASDENPMDVFMVINQINGHIKDIDSNAVIHGHAGSNDDLTYMDEAPYIRIADENEHVITTNVRVTGDRNIKIYFVIKDESKTSAAPTMIEFAKEAVSELDQSAPYFMKAYINNAKDRISLHFNEPLDTDTIIPVSDFTLSIDGETVTSAVYEVHVSNSDWNRSGKVELLLNEAISDITGLKVSYNGTSIKDRATVPNEAEPIIDETVNEAGLSVNNTVVSHNGQYIAMYLDRSVYMEKGKSFEVTLKYGTDSNNATVLEEGKDYNLNWSVASNGWNMEVRFTLNKEPELVPEGKYFITFDANGLKDFAGDSIPVIEATGIPNATAETDVVPTAVYDRKERELILTFGQDSGLYNTSIACCFFKLTVDGKDYILRDFSYFNEHFGDIRLSQENIPLDMESVDWESAKISYSLDVHPTASEWNRLSFTSGMPYQGFSNVSIEVRD